MTLNQLYELLGMKEAELVMTRIARDNLKEQVAQLSKEVDQLAMSLKDQDKVES